MPTAAGASLYGGGCVRLNILRNFAAKSLDSASSVANSYQDNSTYITGCTSILQIVYCILTSERFMVQKRHTGALNLTQY